MKLENSKKYFLGSTLFFTLLGVAVGLLLLFLDASLLLKLVFIIMGIITVISNVPSIVVGMMSFSTREGKIATVFGLLSAVMGFLMIFFHSELLMILLGVYMIVMPILEILLSAQKMIRFKAELPKMILGVVMILVGPAQTLSILFDVAGWVVLALTAIYLIGSLLSLGKGKKAANVTGGRIFVDSTGDGKVDEIYVDTTGDGKVDTSVRYSDSDKE